MRMNEKKTYITQSCSIIETKDELNGPEQMKKIKRKEYWASIALVEGDGHVRERDSGPTTSSPSLINNKKSSLVLWLGFLLPVCY